MKNRKLIAKSNLKKSLYLGGGMAAFTAAIGLAVSIPVYNKIKAELAKSTSKLKDLSGLMGQLTNKLGIPEGASFQKELEGGYEVVYEDGQTKIYKNNGEGKSLIVNMNGDGTVGSAAMGNGPAAQAMLGVIENAKKSMQDDQDAMSDIIGPFANQAEDQSLSTEAAMTGETVAALAQRNALSAGDNAAAKAAAQERLDALIKRNAEIDQAKLNAAKARAQELKAAAEKAKEEADKLAAAKKAGDAAKLLQLQNDQANAAIQPFKDFIASLDYNNPPAAPTTGSADAPGHLSDTEIINLANENSGWAKEAKLSAPSASNVVESKKFLDDLRAFLQAKIDGATSNDDKNNLREYFQTQKIAAVQTRLDKIKADAADALEKAKLAASQRTTDHQMIKAADAGHVTPAIVKLASSLPNAINALMSAEYGYMKEGTFKKPSPSVHKLISDAMKEQGVSDTTLDVIEKKIISPLHSEAKDSSGKPTTVAFTEAVNTFKLKEQSVSRLLVLKATYINKDDKEISQLFLANQTTKSPLDFEADGDVLQSVKSINSDGTPNQMYTAANYLVMAINKNINSSITKDATIALKDVVDKGIDGALKGIKNPAVFNELVKVAKVIDPENKPIQEKALVEILLSLAKKYLFEGKDVTVDGQQIIDLVNNALKYDGTKEPTATLDATEQDTPIQYGPLLTKITAKLNDPTFIDYTDYTKGAAPLIGFVDPKMIGIPEVEEMLKDPDIINKIPNLKNLASSDEGKSIIENHWNTALEIVDNADVNGILKVITEPKFASMMADFNKVSELLSKVKTPVTWEMIYKHFTQLFGLNTDNPDSVKDLSKDTAWAATLQILVSDKPDVTQALKDTLKYASVKGIDLEDPTTIDQINAASDINAQLAGTTGVSKADAQAIGVQMQNVIANPTATERLTPEEFGWVTEYTKTVFTVFGSDKASAVAQLKKVLGDTGALKTNAQKIKTFNGWVKDMQSKGLTISRSAIEKYVWTLDITETPYSQSTGADKMAGGYMIVSAAYNDKDGKTYFVDHKQAGGSRAIGSLERSGDKTLVKKVDGDPESKAKVGGTTPMSSSYISGQTIHDGKIYWMGLNDGAGDGHRADYLYIYTIATGKTDIVKLSRASDLQIKGRVRTLIWVNEKLYAAISDEQADKASPVKEFIEINPTTGSYYYLGQDGGIKFFKDTSQGAYTYTSGAFAVGKTVYIVSPTTIFKDNTKTWITITNRNTGRSSQICLDDVIKSIGGDWDMAPTGVGTILGGFDPDTRIQTIFYVNGNGAVLKLGVKIIEAGDKLIGTVDGSLESKGGGTTSSDQKVQVGDPIIDTSKTLVLIGPDKLNSGTRGATFVGGAITVYGGNKVVYIADQTDNLNDIFKFLMEH